VNPPSADRAFAARDAQRGATRIYGRAAGKGETCLFEWSGDRAYLDELSALLRAGRGERSAHRLDILWLAPAELRWLDTMLAVHYFDLDGDFVELCGRLARWGCRSQGPIQLVRRRASPRDLTRFG